MTTQIERKDRMINTIVNEVVNLNGDTTYKIAALRNILYKHIQSLQPTTEKKCFYCEETKCNCEQQELIERHIADDTTEEKEVEIKRVKCWRCNCECGGHNIKGGYKYCPDCGGYISEHK